MISETRFNLLSEKEKQQTIFTLEEDNKLKMSNPYTKYANRVGSVIVTLFAVITSLGILWVGVWILKGLMTLLGLL
jgi:hypothetical protein